MPDVVERRVINVSDLIEAAPIGVTLCAVLALLDGSDTQVIAFVAPVLATQWSIDLALLGPVFAAGLAGLMIGALAFGSAADWIGRKPALIVSTLIFGIFAGATAYATSTGGLLALRFLTGIGIGGAMPNNIGLTSEYTPKRVRATTINLMAFETRSKREVWYRKAWSLLYRSSVDSVLRTRQTSNRIRISITQRLSGSRN
jgi:MFS transporter, AAHS family, 4-hydroxybenzoate transporter